MTEVQLLPCVVSVIKYLYDNYPLKLIVTGFSSYYIKNLFSESLAGRKKVFELCTLSFREFLRFNEISFLLPGTAVGKKFIAAEYKRLKKQYDEFIRYGEFTEVVLSKKAEDKKDIVNYILSSYLNIDIKNISDIRD